VDVTIDSEQAGRRLDQALAALVPGLSRAEATELLQKGGVRQDGRRAKKGDRVAAEARYTLDPAVLDDRTPEERAVLEGKRQDLVLLGEAERWRAVRKPAGLPSTARHFGDTLHFAACAGTAGLPDCGLVHRLDTGTSGACLFARDTETLERFTLQRDRGELYRIYWAIVAGSTRERGTIDLAIAHHSSDPARMVCVAGENTRHRGKPQEARTDYVTLRSNGTSSLLELRIHGGRRHQIRVHLAHAGHPVLGDPLYGGDREAQRLALHANELVFDDQRFRADPGGHFWAFAPDLLGPG
jgi:23S rRNA pseudouridine1911/1915/1917 synthase